MPKLKRRADGRYVKTFTDPKTGKRKCFYGQTEREVNRKILEYQAKQEAGRTFREVADEWWDFAESELAVQSVNGYDVARRRALEFFGEDILIKDITALQISKYLGSLASQGFGYKTVAKAKLIVNLIFKHAIVCGDVDINRCSDVPMPRGLQKSTRSAATHDEEQAIMNMDDEWIVPFIALMSGLRKGEILALQWKDIDFENNLISVTKSVAHDGNTPFIKQTKTEAGERRVPLLKPLRDRLEAIEDKTPEHFIVSIDGGKSPLTKKVYQTKYKQFKKRNNITATAHPLRHSFATLAVENEVPLKSLQGLMGHAQASTTINIYAHVRDKAISEAAEILNNSPDFKTVK